jgi:CheY-like chemotaxis protein
MPELDGLEFLRIMRETGSKVKGVARSGKFEGQFLKAAEQLGAKAILLKPFSEELLLHVIGESLTDRNPLPESR